MPEVGVAVGNRHMSRTSEDDLYSLYSVLRWWSRAICWQSVVVV